MNLSLGKGDLGKLRIGLLGGSFNPAHEGHIHISETAIKCLKLDHVIWLVSPQNPLKSKAGMASFASRFRKAKSIIKHPRIHVSDFESVNRLIYTKDTLECLLTRHPDTHFTWLMGADSLLHFHLWKGWQYIFQMVPVAIMDRPGYAYQALSSMAARRFQRFRIPAAKADKLANLVPPAWVFLPIRKHKASATEIRSRLKSRG